MQFINIIFIYYSLLFFQSDLYNLSRIYILLDNIAEIIYIYRILYDTIWYNTKLNN